MIDVAYFKSDVTDQAETHGKIEQYIRRIAKNRASYGLGMCSLCSQASDSFTVYIPDLKHRDKFKGDPSERPIIVYATCPDHRFEDEPGARESALLKLAEGR